MGSNVLRGNDDVPCQDHPGLHAAIEAVCAELGLVDRAAPRRAAVEARMWDAYRRGPRLNLNLVDAGLSA